MKYLIMCEGPNEREIINILLENDLLKFTEDDLLGLTPYPGNIGTLPRSSESCGYRHWSWLE